MRPRAGMRMINGIEVAIAQPIFISQLGRQFILVGTTTEHTILFLDNKERKTIKIHQLDHTRTI